jgi:hypothetical protein
VIFLGMLQRAPLTEFRDPPYSLRFSTHVPGGNPKHHIEKWKSNVSHAPAAFVALRRFAQDVRFWVSRESGPAPLVSIRFCHMGWCELHLRLNLRTRATNIYHPNIYHPRKHLPLKAHYTKHDRLQQLQHNMHHATHNI